MSSARILLRRTTTTSRSSPTPRSGGTLTISSDASSFHQIVNNNMVICRSTGTGIGIGTSSGGSSRSLSTRGKIGMDTAFRSLRSSTCTTGYNRMIIKKGSCPPPRHAFPAPIRLHSSTANGNVPRFNLTANKSPLTRFHHVNVRANTRTNVHVNANANVKANVNANKKSCKGIIQHQRKNQRPFVTTSTCRLFHPKSIQNQQRAFTLRNQKARSKSTTAKPSASSSSSPSSPPPSSSSLSLSKIANLKHKLQLQLLQPRIIPIPRWISPRPFSFTISECFGHASFILVAISYATDDFLLLRIIAVAGSTSMLFFTYFHPHGRVLWLPFKWNLLFILINTFRIVNSLYYHYIGYYIMMSDDDKRRVKEDYFDIMDMSDFAKLCSIATEEVLREGEMVVFQGSKNPYVRMVVEGELDVLRDGVRTYSLGEGNFVTEAGLHAGLSLTGTVESCCTIVAQRRSDNGEGRTSSADTGKVAARCLRWNRTELVELLNQNSGLRRSLKAVLSWDIVRKLKGQRQTISDHMVEDAEFWTQKRQEQSENRYAAILQNMLQNPEYFKKHKNALDHYRTIHHIDDDRHRQALKTCGWTPSEYEAGERVKEIHEDDGLL